MAAIVERAPQAREVAPQSARFKFVAQLEESGSSRAMARGAVSVVQGDGSTSRRDVADAPCGEVVESMAVILSLILAGTESPPAPTPVVPIAIAPAGAPAPSPAAPPAEQSTAPAAPAEQPPQPQPPQPPAPAATPAQTPPLAEPREPSTDPAAPEEEPSAEPGDSARLRWGLRLAALVETGVAPSVALGGQGGLDLWWARGGLWSPSARLTGRYVRSPVEDTDYGSARFQLAALRAELCPLRWPERSKTFGRVCPLFEVGQLEADAQTATQGDTQNQTMPWFGGGGSLRLESTLADILSLEAAADLLVLGRTDRFTFEPGAHTVHEVPRISAMFSLGAVLRLP